MRRRKAALVYTNTIVTIAGAIGGRLAGVPVVWHVREILSVSRPVRMVLYLALRARDIRPEIEAAIILDRRFGRRGTEVVSGRRQRR